MQNKTYNLYPEVNNFEKFTLKAGNLHEIYYEVCGNPKGSPVVFLHGGPGSGCSPTQRRFFDPAHYRIILLDQRGCGRSQPLGSIDNNTTSDLVEDLNQLRVHLNIEQWLVFGGSWGSTLALAYGEAHPERCLGFILRGIFLCTKAEVDWFVNGMGYFYPEIHQRFAEAIPVEERGDLLQAYVKRLFCDDPAIYMEAARNWSRYEGSCLFLKPQA